MQTSMKSIIVRVPTKIHDGGCNNTKSNKDDIDAFSYYSSHERRMSALLGQERRMSALLGQDDQVIRRSDAQEEEKIRRRRRATTSCEARVITNIISSLHYRRTRLSWEVHPSRIVAI